MLQDIHISMPPFIHSFTAHMSFPKGKVHTNLTSCLYASKQTLLFTQAHADAMGLPLMCRCPVHLSAGTGLYRQPGTAERGAGNINRSIPDLRLGQCVGRGSKNRCWSCSWSPGSRRTVWCMRCAYLGVISNRAGLSRTGHSGKTVLL